MVLLICHGVSNGRGQLYNLSEVEWLLTVKWSRKSQNDMFTAQMPDSKQLVAYLHQILLCSRLVPPHLDAPNAQRTVVQRTTAASDCAYDTASLDDGMERHVIFARAE